jgi:hypothetical protein
VPGVSIRHVYEIQILWLPAHATTKNTFQEVGTLQHMSACSSRPYLLCFVLLLISFSNSLAAQEKEPGKGEAGRSGKLVKVEGTVRCDNPDPAYSIEVPDRSGHALMIAQRKCSWTKPLVVLDAKTKVGVAVSFTEKMEGALHMHGYEVDTLDNGEKLTMRIMTQILAEKAPASFRGRWSFMRGTGKFKGIKGGGTYDGKLEEGGGLTLDLEGSYVPEEMAAGKK